MKDIAGLLLFARVAETLSFAEAARRVGLSPSALGKSVARLEARFGVRLFQRSTRRVSLTAEGALLLERVRRIVAELDDIDAVMARATATPSGRLRLSLPTIGYRFLVPILPAFHALYPAIELDLDFDDRQIDVIGEGVDAVIRGGKLPDSQLMSRRLGTFDFLLCAAPAYVSARGMPEAPDQLVHHARLCFRFAFTGVLQDWPLPASMTVAMLRPPALVCNNMEAVRAASVAGLGIAYMPRFLAAEDLARGSLVPVLEDWITERGTFWLLWPSSRHLSPKLRAFADFVATRIGFGA